MGKIERVYRNPDGTFDIVFDRNNDQEYDDTAEEIELYTSVEQIAATINNLQGSTNEIKERFFGKLLGIAQVGFVGENHSVGFALTGIKSLQNEILQSEGAKIKNKYHIGLGGYSLVALGMIWIIYLIVQSISSVIDPSYFLVLTGALVGQWLSFGVRKMNLEFEDLSAIEQDKMSKPIRIIFILLSAFIVFLILNSGIISFQFGGFSSQNLNQWENQIIVGCLAGLLDSKLGLKLYEKANEITN